MSQNELNPDAIEILKRMGYREFEGAYIKPIGFSIFIFKFYENDNVWTLSEHFIGSNDELICYKSIDVLEMDNFSINYFQTLESNVKGDLYTFYHWNSDSLVPELKE